MEYEKFCEWIMSEKNLSKRSARDVVSRLRRALTLLNNGTITDESLALLNSSTKFSECSMFIKSQLKRSIALYNEFQHK